jgi:flagellar motor switch protein FliM
VGDRIALGVSPGAPVRLACGPVGLFEAQLGRRENRLAVRIERALPRGGRPGAAGGAATQVTEEAAA